MNNITNIYAHQNNQLYIKEQINTHIKENSICVSTIYQI